MGKEVFEVVVDDRERGGGLRSFLEKAEGVTVRKERLTTGDYEVAETFCFERKIVRDFVASVIDGRLFGQAARLRNCGLRPVFLVEGPKVEIDSSGVSREALQGAFVSLMLIFDIPLLRTFSEEESARVMVYAGQQLVRSRTERNHRRPVVKRRSFRGRQLQVIQSFPGVGRDRAAAALEHFGSLGAFLGADREALLGIPGLGPKTVDGIVRLKDPS